MKSISDMDLGINCDFVARGESNDEVVQASTEHIQETHPEEWDRVKGMLKMNIKEE